MVSSGRLAYRRPFEHGGLHPPGGVTSLNIDRAQSLRGAYSAASGSDVKQEISSENSSMERADAPDSSTAERSSL